MDKTLLWVWLSLHMKQGTHIYKYLLDEFGDIESIYDCVDADVAHIPWLYDNHKRKILDKNLDRAKEVVRWCQKAGVKILTLEDDEFPKKLMEIKECPGVLYYLGDLPEFNKELCIGVVGTRDMTVYGEEAAFEMGYCLSKGGALVVSGGAIGIDSTAQKGALAADCRTVTILGSGIDVLYPYQNKELFIKIAQSGVIITEYPPHTPPNGYNFPVRNRLISGISNGLVVVEADRNSGAMITAEKAILQGRPLYSVPGPIGRFQSTGTNSLIRSGAKSVTSALDVLEEYLEEYSDIIQITSSKEKPDLTLLHDDRVKDDNKIKKYLGAIGHNIKKKIKKSNFKTNTAQKNNKIEINSLNLDENTKTVYEFMESGKRYNADSFDELGLSSSVILSSFTLLEIYNVIKSLPGGFYEKI